jgi:hypothetical protein
VVGSPVEQHISWQKVQSSIQKDEIAKGAPGYYPKNSGSNLQRVEKPGSLLTRKKYTGGIA